MFFSFEVSLVCCVLIGDTALISAAAEGHIECLELLLDKGSDAKARNVIGAT